MFATVLGAEQRASLHLQRCSLLGGYPGHNALLIFYENFQENPDNCVETNRMGERFFDEKSISRKLKMTACVE
jgi:hypothetical protein